MNRTREGGYRRAVEPGSTRPAFAGPSTKPGVGSPSQDRLELLRGDQLVELVLVLAPCGGCEEHGPHRRPAHGSISVGAQSLSDASRPVEDSADGRVVTGEESNLRLRLGYPGDGVDGNVVVIV